MFDTCRGILLALAIAFHAMPARGEVVASSPGGFSVKSSVEIAEAPRRVYDEIVNNPGGWWDPQHTFWGDSRNLSIDARPNGCFCEIASKDRGARHMMVVLADPGKSIRMSGALGPLQSLAVSGSLTITLQGSEDGTKLVLEYTVGGYSQGGLESWASPVDRVLTMQVTRLKNYVETGSPSKSGR